MAIIYIRMDQEEPDEGDMMKKTTIFYTAMLGMFWEAVYTMAIIGMGLILALSFGYPR
ncbi:MAG: hypothetical protein WCY12_06130 [Candidatus Omnitrophota bacterium]